RPAKIGDKLTTHQFNGCTTGFAAPEDANMAVCVLPGTELAFTKEVRCEPSWLLRCNERTFSHATAIFRQVKQAPHCAQHDRCESPDTEMVLLSDLAGGQGATVLQLPARPARAAGVWRREPVALVG